MSKSNPQRVIQVDEQVTAAMAAARSLGRAIEESAAFKRFDAAYGTFMADDVARHKLRDYQLRQQQLRMAEAWGGADQDQREKLEREWRSISSLPTIGLYLREQEELTILLRETVGKISAGIGVDFGIACAPSGGCC